MSIAKKVEKMSNFGKILIVVSLIAIVIAIKLTKDDAKTPPPAPPVATSSAPAPETKTDNTIPVTVLKDKPAAKVSKDSKAEDKKSEKKPAAASDDKKIVKVKPADKPVVVKKNAKLPRLLELGSESCQPCRMMQSVLAELRTEYAGRLQVDYIDIYQDTAAAEKYKIQFIPVQVLFDADGNEIFRHTGFFPKDKILQKFSELKVQL